MFLSKSFLTRVVSAIIALVLIITVFQLWNVLGLKYIISFAVLVGIYELIKILFHQEKSYFLKTSFGALALVTYASSIASLSLGSLVYSIALILMTIFTLLKVHKSGDLVRMTGLIATSSLGLFYVGLLPSFAFRILDQAYGLEWFVFLLAVVFSGDTMAYLFGVAIGKHKVMPTISPKKTWQGSIGGLFGSAVASILCSLYVLPNVSMQILVPLALAAGFVGQFGDFFESLLKRVANVKDSGKIMPGHGGVLDRIDAVLFASPVVLLGIILLSYLG